MFVFCGEQNSGSMAEMVQASSNCKLASASLLMGVCKLAGASKRSVNCSARQPVRQSVCTAYVSQFVGHLILADRSWQSLNDCQIILKRIADVETTLGRTSISCSKTAQPVTTEEQRLSHWRSHGLCTQQNCTNAIAHGSGNV